VRLEAPILLAAGFFEIVRIVFHLHGHPLLRTRTQGMRDIRCERRVPSFVLGHWTIVEPHPRVIIDSAEVQEHPAVGLLARKLELALIPATAMKTGVADAAELRLRRERHFDGQRPAVDAGRRAMTHLVVE
jgi:hypothetical protein